MSQPPQATPGQSPADPSTPTLWRCFATAVEFLTRVPLTDTTAATPAYCLLSLRRAVVFFPLVGALIGVFTASLFWIGSINFPPLVAAFIAIGCEAMLTGAFHEDAFADTWDALGGGWTRAQVLEIMKDSRLGTYGTIALVVGVGLRVAAIASFPADKLLWGFASIVAASTLGRIAIVGMMATTAPIGDRESAAKDVSGTQTWGTVFVASMLTMPFWVPWFSLHPAIAIGSTVAAVLVLAWFRRKIVRRVGGTTGDLLGCSAYLVQLVVLIGSTCHA